MAAAMVATTATCGPRVSSLHAREEGKGKWQRGERDCAAEDALTQPHLTTFPPHVGEENGK